MRRLTLTAAALLAAVTLSSCGSGSADVALEDRPTMPIGSPSSEQTAMETTAAEDAVFTAATVVESKATSNMYDNPGKPAVGITGDWIETQIGEYDEYDQFDGANITIAWPENFDPNTDDGPIELGYDLCVEMTDGSWATWDESHSRVKASGLTGGCNA